MTYSPGLTRAVFDRLKNSCGCDSMWTSCCGKPLEQMGLRQRLRDTRANLKEFAQKYKIRRIITACSGCYYDLQSLFQSSDVAIQTVYEVMDFSENAGILGKRCAVHDSCPDRYAGTFGKQVRQALARKGFTIVEMLHNQTNTICCGSGGQLSHFRPDLVEKLVSMRLAEARQADADILAGYCLSCVLKYGSKSEIPVAHVLNLLLDIEADFKGAKERAAKMLSGPDGEKLWEQIMAD